MSTGLMVMTFGWADGPTDAGAAEPEGATAAGVAFGEDMRTNTAPAVRHTTLGLTSPFADTLWFLRLMPCPAGQVNSALKRRRVDG